MSNVLVDKNKIDLLANAISDKSGEPLKLTLDEMVEAVDGIEVGGGSAESNLQAKTYTVDSAGTETITADNGYDGLSSVSVSVPSADPYVSVYGGQYYTENNQRKWRIGARVEVSVQDGDKEGWLADGYSKVNDQYSYDAIPTGTTIVPTESSQHIGGNNYMMENRITVSAIPSNYVGSGITQRSSSDLTASGATVSVPSGYYASNASKAVASGSAGTPTATKGAVSNHAVNITPSVTNTAGYISGGTVNGTAVSVSASELVSGSQTLSDNGDYDVTNLASVTVDVSGGGGGSLTVATKTTTLGSASSSIAFTGLSGNPLSFVITSSTEQTTGGTKVVSVAYDGTSLHGMDITTEMTADTGFTKSYSSGTLTVTATTASFQANEYKLVYVYGGTSSDIHTADVQVGSGATSITFSGLSGRPAYFSCVFKSDFGTSSGYQRVIDVVNDGTNTYGNAMDSSAKAQTSWSYSYSGGSLTITSQGTNNGGYFHQPGYYQLTYAVDDSAPNYQTKTGIGASTSSQTITADAGYDALESVQINAVSQTNLTAGNIKSGTTISISNGSTNLWSVTGTYDGGSSGSVSYDTKTVTASNYPVSLEFTSMKGEPKFFVVRLNTSVSSSGSTTYYYIVDIASNGTTTHGNCFRIGSTRQVNSVTSGYSWSYSGTTLTITSSAASRSASPGAFYSGSYELMYAY